jgi:hypothetical protein
MGVGGLLVTGDWSLTTALRDDAAFVSLSSLRTLLGFTALLGMMALWFFDPWSGPVAQVVRAHP